MTTTSLSLVSPSASGHHGEAATTTEPASSGAGSTTRYFAFDKQSACLSDLEIVRKIVEREGCIEALEQLLRSHKSVASMQSPVVIQSIVDQLRAVSLLIVEAIAAWKRGGAATFYWRNHNYLLKMASDLDHLADLPVVASMANNTRSTLLSDTLRLLQCKQNPFLSPVHLRHSALHETTPDIALRYAPWVGHADMKRIFAASKLVLEELERTSTKAKLLDAHGVTGGACTTGQCDTIVHSHTMAMRDTSSGQRSRGTSNNQSPSRTHQQQHQQQSAVMNGAIAVESHDLDDDGNVEESSDPQLLHEDPHVTMVRDVELSQQLVAEAEHEVGAIREELAVLQNKLRQATLPDKRRKLQTRIGALTNELKFRSGDVYQRKNELRRKEGICRATARDLSHSRLGHSQSQSSFASSHGSHGLLWKQQRTTGFGSAALSDALDAAIQADELVRQELVEKLVLHQQPQTPSAGSVRKAPHAKHGGFGRHRHEPPKHALSAHGLPLEQLTPELVQQFVDALALAPSYGRQLYDRGIDGALLAQANEHDLIELGIPIRLHRLRILEAAERAMRSPVGAVF
ncbi:TPA: hypothetical protein N0F65_005306 [Lagenidium giganteum]|uniref:SAM domain-containing protein n=1 Tax=Lagenidium giganteum TaxID=4803 RepID=A0AAV2Z3S7_9STRA|nr:TPA: hypothetical protein N0F65_005306 [Lagenidium giganteum]